MAMTLRVDDELDEALTELADALGTSKQDVVRRAVLDLRDRSAHKQRVGEASRRALEEWGDVLDRLGKA